MNRQKWYDWYSKARKVQRQMLKSEPTMLRYFYQGVSSWHGQQYVSALVLGDDPIFFPPVDRWALEHNSQQFGRRSSRPRSYNKMI